MIKYNNSNINDWYYDTSDIIKVYRNNAVCYYKVTTSGGTPEYKVCYAVVDDISQYSETEYEDVFDKATEKWYKLNNLNQYEEYGIYGSGRTECSGSSRLPDGYTEVKYVQNTGSSTINTNFYPNTNTRVLCEMEMITTQTYPKLFGAGTWNVNNSLFIEFGNTLSVHWIGSSAVDYSDYPKSFAFAKHKYDLNKGNLYIDDTLVGTNSYSSVVSVSSPLGIFSYINGSTAGNADEHFLGKLYTFKIYDDGTLVRDFIPAKRDSDNVGGLYDIVNDVFYTPMESNAPLVAETDCVTTYNGKLTIDDGYEYEWNGSSWINVGEVSGSSRVPVGYTEVEYVENTSSAYIDLNVYPYSSTTNSYEIETKISSTQGASQFEYLFSCEQGDASPYYGCFLRWQTTTPRGLLLGSNPDNTTKSIINNGDGTSAITLSCTQTEGSNTTPVTLWCGKSGNTVWRNGKGKFYTFKLTVNSSLVRDMIPCKRDSDSKVGMYDIVNDVFYTSTNGYNLVAGAETSSTEYPLYYDEKSDPLNNLTFSSMTEANEYAYNNCVYDGMHATIDGDRYYFDSSDENGWVKILEYYKFEDVTPNAASGWTISGSSTYNPDSSYYDDFDLETTSTSNTYKIAKVTIYGYDHFTYYLRSYHGFSSSYGYIISTNVDEIQTPPTSMSYNSSSAITNTYSWNKSPKSDVNLSNYRRITYNNLDKTVEHTFYVYFYGRTYSSYVGNATILIPKEQTNENWEQVTFSSSTNVSGATKNLYIDGNNSSSGGTSYFYNRWMIGLPSGSHSSYTNYSNYHYCPNVTSSTFTSVAGEQRQVNFTYDGTTDKNLSFRLTDGSNVLTPSDTVYYNMTYYNSCGVSSSSSNLTFPRSQNVKVGGSFSFGNSSNRHYIYGYSPNISLNTDYYVDNYQSTFDITYTKLSEEAVTITYTTYDPNDVEIPAFNTDITYPYNGGTTSSTTLTSYAVPYTYPYEVSQTSDKFSADSQTYTANQAARTINFVLYPNNREFATVADMEAYQYAWEGMKATVGDTKYKYENGEWVENQHSLPDVPFTLNYNAKQYNASTKTLLKTEGQLANVDAVITAGTPTVHDGYLAIASNTRATISGYQNYFNRDNNNPNLTIISKQRTDGNNGHMFANRDANYNWMYRCYSNKLTLHGTSEQGSVAVTTQPVIESVRVNSSRLATYNNYTNNTSSTYSSFNYGNTNSTATALFAGYAQNTGEWFVGDFYWVYMTQNTLTDEQIQQVIDYNENL